MTEKQNKLDQRRDFKIGSENDAMKRNCRERDEKMSVRLEKPGLADGIK